MYISERCVVSTPIRLDTPLRKVRLSKTDVLPTVPRNQLTYLDTPSRRAVAITPWSKPLIGLLSIYCAFCAPLSLQITDNNDNETETNTATAGQFLLPSLFEQK